MEGEVGGGRDTVKQEDVSHSFKTAAYLKNPPNLKGKSDEINKPITVWSGGHYLIL